MAKRFADTNKYKKPFMRGLPGPYKLLWDYLYLECDHAGVWHKDFEVAQLYIGKDMPVNEAQALKLFNEGQERIRLNADGDKWLIMGFADFQYGKLNPMNRVHHAAILALTKFGVTPSQGATIAPVDMDKDKAVVKDVIVFSREKAFEQIWAKYPVKDGRKEAERLFNATVGNADDLTRIQKALNNYLRSPKVRGGFVKNGSTWFANWQDWVDYKGEVHGAGTKREDSNDLDKLLERQTQERHMG